MTLLPEGVALQNEKFADQKRLGRRDFSPSGRRAIFIDPFATRYALRQEGHIYRLEFVLGENSISIRYSKYSPAERRPAPLVSHT